jgi:DNA-binding GntR family transcriptional regulator
VALPARIDLDRRAIPEQIAHGLTRLVLSGELPPGRALQEGTIASDLGVSRTTVREGVRLLERSGLVRYESNRGAVVREPSPSNVRDVYRARLAVELGAACASFTELFDAAPIEQATAALGAAVDGGDPGDAVAADLEFHAAIVAAAGSTRLTDAFTGLSNELRLYVTTLSARAGQDPVRPVLSEHDAITAAARSGDRGELVALLTQHITEEAARAMALVDDGADGPATPRRG